MKHFQCCQLWVIEEFHHEKVLLPKVTLSGNVSTNCCTVPALDLLRKYWTTVLALYYIYVSYGIVLSMNHYRSIIIKEKIEPTLGMICQLEDGLASYGLLKEIRKYPSFFQPLFVSSNLFDVTPDEFLHVNWSENQAERYLEQTAFKYFSDFVEFLYHAVKILVL